MRRVLILGGTGWLGARIAAAHRDDGAAVTCLARGGTGLAPADVEFVQADRLTQGAYDAVCRDWDEVVEVTSDPRLVVPALDALSHRAAHWTLVSSVSVYADNATPYADETAALVMPTDLSRYADAKAAAEQTSHARVGERLLIARPGLIVGPGDPSDRFGYWAARMLRGGRVLRPKISDRFVQVIDVDDLATWIAQAGTARLAGTVNAVGHTHSMAQFFDDAVRATSFDGSFTDASDDALLRYDVAYWAGPRSLPLWLPETDTAFAQRDGSRFLASGGVARPLSETLSRVAADETARGIDRPRHSGLSAAEASEVLRALESEPTPHD